MESIKKYFSLLSLYVVFVFFLPFIYAKANIKKRPFQHILFGYSIYVLFAILTLLTYLLIRLGFDSLLQFSIALNQVTSATMGYDIDRTTFEVIKKKIKTQKATKYEILFDKIATKYTQFNDLYVYRSEGSLSEVDIKNYESFMLKRD